MLVGRALCRADPSGKGAGGDKMGGVAPVVERFEATLPLRGAATDLSRM